MKLLVIGRSGQVARAMAARDGDHNIAAVGRPDVDLNKPDSVRNAIIHHHPDLVINAAAYTGVDQAEEEQDQAFALNDLGAGYVAEACTNYGCPLIHISTDYVFDGTKSIPYCETDPTAPLGIYGASKYAGEQRVAKHCPEHVIVRTAWVHSPFGKNFVKTMLQLAKDRSEIGVVNDQVGSPTYALDLAQVILEIALQLHRNGSSAPWGTYHVAGTGEASWYEVAEKIFEASEALGGVSATVVPIPTSAYSTPAKRPQNSRLDCQKLKQNFAITMPDWKLGVEDCVRQLVVP